MGRVRTEDQSILCRGAYSRRTEVWKVLGDPRRCRETRRSATDAATGNIRSGSLLDHTNLMPLMNTAFAPGHCREAVEAMTAGPQRDIAMAEYYYFSGRPEEAAKEVESYLTSPDMGGAALRLPDLRLCQSFHRTGTESQICFGGTECLPCRRRRAIASVSGGIGFYCVDRGGVTPFAAAKGNARGR